ncbi:MAG: hypothetical protein GY694_03470 [Gammaproteobacteria bacterium]|nr:hypothetical protein [Gammaproteobacteria bacterium]
MTCFIMKDKLEDAQREVRKTKEEYSSRLENYKQEIMEGSHADKML